MKGLQGTKASHPSQKPYRGGGYLEKYLNGERLDLLKQAVVFANNSIFEERQEQENLANMSCVLAAALIEMGEKANQHGTCR